VAKPPGSRPDLAGLSIPALLGQADFPAPEQCSILGEELREPGSDYPYSGKESLSRSETPTNENPSEALQVETGR
jgi:hypothetical protein